MTQIYLFMILSKNQVYVRRVAQMVHKVQQQDKQQSRQRSCPVRALVVLQATAATHATNNGGINAAQQLPCDKYVSTILFLV